MSGWKIQAIPLLILSALLAGCQTPSSGRITLDLPVLRTARVDATAAWRDWWREPGGDELAGRAQLASLPDAAHDEPQRPRPAESGEVSSEPRPLPDPVTQPIPIENAEAVFSTEFLPPPAASDWTRRP